MKKLLLFVAVLGFITLSHTVNAQDEKEKSKKESQEIIIRKKGDKDTKIIVEITGDKVTINGKPLTDFKDDDITINKKNITIWDRNSSKEYELALGNLDMARAGFENGLSYYNGKGKEVPFTFLGVTTDEVEDGAKITEITKESAAEKAGLKKDDIITKIGDKKINGPESLSEVVRGFKPKEEVTIYFKREGKEISSKAILGERKESASMSYAFSSPGNNSLYYSKPNIPNVPRMKTIPNSKAWDDKAFDYRFDMLGDLYPRHQKLGLKIQDTEDGNGVKVLDVDKDSPAEKAGLKKDDILTEVGGKKVSNTDDAREELQENKDKPSYTIKARRNGSEMNFDIKFPKKLKTTNL